MALTTETGTFVQQPGTGAQVVPTAGQGIAVIFSIASNLTAAGTTTAEFMHMHGFACADGTQAAICTITDTGPVARDQQTNTACIHIIESGGGTTVARATITAIAAGSFTINWATNDSVARVITYHLIVGATNAKILTKQVAASTGVANYIGAGFKPDFIHTLTMGEAGGAVSSSGSFADMGIGFASSATLEAAMSMDISTGSTHEKIQVTNASVITTDSVGGVYNRGDLDAFTADGFDINWTVTSNQAYFYTLCIKGGGFYQVGSFNQATSTGAQAVTVTGQLPAGMIVASSNGVASVSVITTNARRSLGMVSGTTARSCTWAGSDTTNNNTSLSTSFVMQHITEGTPTVNASADHVSFASDTWNITWGSADGTARQIIFVSFGNAAPAAFDPANNTSWAMPTIGPRRQLVEVFGT